MAFLNQLEEMGFYVARCSRTNYIKTQSSMASSLNMSYLPDLYVEAATLGIPEEDIWILIKPSKARQNFETLGYQIVLSTRVINGQVLPMPISICRAVKMPLGAICDTF
jgi:lambda repressor-like predicted transcriptional regulator